MLTEGHNPVRPSTHRPRHSRSARGSVSRQNTSIVILNIPPKKCAIDQINEFFKKFGSIINITVNPRFSKANVQFSTHHEAQRAIESPEAVFDNRFVKVVWSREAGEQQHARPEPNGSRVHKPDQPLPIDSQPPAETKPDQAALEAEAELRAKKQEKLKAVLDLQKQKEALIQKQIEEQKKIMDMLEKNKNMDSKVREELMNSLKSINKNLQPLIKTTEEALAKSINPSGQSSKEPADTSGNEELQATVAKLKAEVWFYSQDNSKLILPFRLKHWASQTQLQPRNQRLQ